MKLMNNQKNLKAKLAAKLRIERAKRNISQEKLAALSDISLLTVGTIERETNSPSIETLAKIADALDMKLCNLLNFD